LQISEFAGECRKNAVGVKVTFALKATQEALPKISTGAAAMRGIRLRELYK
jgi:hypothetical protein